MTRRLNDLQIYLSFTQALPRIHCADVFFAAGCRLRTPSKDDFGEEDGMKMFKQMTIALAVVLMAAVLTPTASAGCSGPQPFTPGASLQPQSWHRNAEVGPASLLLVRDVDDPIVGMWQVHFIAKGNGPDGPPDFTTIDSGIVQWHSDGTEIMNSGRPAQDGNFCLGVWEKTGKFRYKLNHFALGNDTTNAPSGIGNPAGPTNIREDIVLTRGGDHYIGTFTLDAYDTSGNRVAQILGVVTGTRITVETPAKSLFQ
jgi:hypothetical protein